MFNGGSRTTKKVVISKNWRAKGAVEVTLETETCRCGDEDEVGG